MLCRIVVLGDVEDVSVDGRVFKDFQGSGKVLVNGIQVRL